MELLQNHMRLMRKDELIVVSSVRVARSPPTFQKKLAEVKLPKSIKKIVSSAIEESSFRILIEKSNGEAAIVKTNAHGTEVSYDYIPLDSSILSKSRVSNNKATLENYGEVRK